MADQKIFCNVPWHNIHVYWNGDLSVCCAERTKWYPESKNNRYNLKNISIDDWYNSDFLNDIRAAFLNDGLIPQCDPCYKAEQSGFESRRVRENFKSVIFTEQDFAKSYLQSPWVDRFDNPGKYKHTPLDWHVDFGNQCNLACKMCDSNSSSMIASVLKNNNRYSGPVKVSWTSDPQSWNNFLHAVDNTPIKRFHVMGGEPLLITKYIEFIDYLIDKKRFEISLSFVTNGTVLNPQLIDKLKLFKSVDIEISIETIYKTNDYIRQGSDIDQLLKNIEQIKSAQTDNFQLILRTVPQLLSINGYHDMIAWAKEQDLIIESIPLTNPDFLAVNMLPLSMRMAMIDNYTDLQQQLSDNISFNQILNGRARGTINEKLLREVNSVIQLLKQPEPADVDEKRQRLVEHLRFWDNHYKFNFDDYYPEFAQLLKSWGY
jgi:molybdenum cofactor biosynthesis enzyme MoaA